MPNRARRGGGAADRFIARQTEEITVDGDENDALQMNAAPPDDEPDIDIDIEEDNEPPFEPDYSHDPDHEQNHQERQPEEPEPEPDGVAVLKRQLEEMRGERDALRQRADAGEIAELEANQARLQHATTAARQALASAKADFKAAMGANDADKAADAQEAIATAAADIRQFEDAADDLKNAIAHRKANPRQPARQAQQPAGDPQERVIASFDARLQPWIRQNKADLFKSEARGKMAEAAHFGALDAGLAEFSPEYFDHMNKTMGYEVAPKRQQQAPRRPVGRAQTAAPTGSRANGGRPANEVSLSRAEVQIAAAMGMSVKKYAANKAKIIENGKDPANGGHKYSAQTQHSRR